MALQIELYWQGHRAGVMPLEGDDAINFACLERIDMRKTIPLATWLEDFEKALTFDRDFAELYGLTGVELEPAPD